MARRTLGELFEEARTYLDTDDLNFPDDLLMTLMRRVWYQAVNMETEWRFLLVDGTTLVDAEAERVPMSFTVDALAGSPTRSAARLTWLRWQDTGATTEGPLMTQVMWRRGEYAFHDNLGVPMYWADELDGGVRYVRLFPRPVNAGTLTVGMVLIPEFPDNSTGTLADLPEEFDDALLQALLAEMYMREEDGDLYQFQRSMFMEQMGSIKERWRGSNPERLVMAGDAYARRGVSKQYQQPRLTGSGW